jgi:P2X purinoceptor 7
LRRSVILVAVRDMNDVFAYNNQPANDNFRHAAYRQFVLWRYEHLGSGNRVVIPSCVVWAIRDRFPSPDGTYTGFKVARLA